MRRHRALWSLAFCGCLLACRRGDEPAPAPPAQAAPLSPPSPLEWTAEGPGGRGAIHQTPVAGGCRLTAVVSGATRWSAEACAGTRDDLHFVSADGDRLVVLHPLPEGVRGKDWSEAIVARILVRGREERRFLGAELVSAAAIAEMSRDYSWVKGIGSGGGTAPRYAADGGAVVLEVVDGATLTLGFDGSGAPRRPTARAAAAAATATPPPASAGAADTRLWRWEDADGSVNFSHWEEIPPARRRGAEPVTATVGNVGGGSSGGGSWDSAAPGYGRGSAPRPDPGSAKSAGPRLNGLTDGERHEQEVARLKAEEAKNLKDAELWQRQRERNQQLDQARAERRWPYR